MKSFVIEESLTPHYKTTREASASDFFNHSKTHSKPNQKTKIISYESQYTNKLKADGKKSSKFNYPPKNAHKLAPPQMAKIALVSTLTSYTTSLLLITRVVLICILFCRCKHPRAQISPRQKLKCHPRFWKNNIVSTFNDILSSMFLNTFKLNFYSLKLIANTLTFPK